MLIVILVLLAAISVIIIMKEINIIHLLLTGLYMSCISIFIGLILFFSKSGGLTYKQQIFLFLSQGIRSKLEYLAISLDTIGYFIVIGRSLFPLFLLLLAMNYSMIPWVRATRILYKLIMVPSIFFLIIYYPSNYRGWLKGHLDFQKYLNNLFLCWMIIYIILALFLFVYEYNKITISFIKKKFLYIILSQASITILYIVFAIENPVYIFQPFGYQFLWGKYSYINPNISLDKWMVFFSLIIFLIVFGAFNIINTYINYDDKDEDELMKRKVRTAGEVVTIFIHGIKNQLIALKVLSRNIKNLLEVEDINEIDIEKLRENANKLYNLSDQMTLRMEELHKSFKSKSITLHIVEIDKVIDKAYSKFKQKYPFENVNIIYEEKNIILADIDHLSEAIYNLMVNGYEALIRCNDCRVIELKVTIKSERLYNVIIVQDNGIGIDKNKKSKIFDPFFTDKNSNQNWGMGLYYVRKIAKYHFGFTRVESIENVGTKFYVMIPKYGKQG